MDPLGMKASTSGLGRVGASGDEAFLLEAFGAFDPAEPKPGSSTPYY